jgi:hypothetical protein
MRSGIEAIQQEIYRQRALLLLQISEVIARKALLNARSHSRSLSNHRLRSQPRLGPPGGDPRPQLTARPEAHGRVINYTL